MANVYVGFHDQRSCNRILKPPGGGTSNIFGTDLVVPDVIPNQISPKRESKQSTTIQHIIQTESSSTNTTSTTEENLNSSANIEVPRQNGTNEVTIKENGTSNPPDVTAVVTSKVEEMKIEERSTKSLVTETDSSGNTKVISNDSSSEGSVQLNSSFKQGSSIGDILKQDDVIEEKKKVKSPTQRVPPGGYSSGLW
ncbi:uncharacterized protein LOC115887464 [Sitophilus oryzae]|uniref:Uncharacterized protein LOC115887464 n=1 Tax=Sitophilus oryzae TaxID=7048 RepID=A0A6J2YI11_SITOR|nr:uncharacterized protein LOC115887464 [Sitophilus oryzae]